MDPKDFVELAEQLVVARMAAAGQFRTAIGRAYYGTFNFGSQVLDQLGFPPTENAQGRNQTVRLFQQSGDPTLEAAAGLLSDLHTLRLKADYQLKRTDVEKMKVAQAAVESADSIFDDLDAFLGDPARRSAVTATLGPGYRSLTGKPNP